MVAGLRKRIKENQLDFQKREAGRVFYPSDLHGEFFFDRYLRWKPLKFRLQALTMVRILEKDRKVQWLGGYDERVPRRHRQDDTVTKGAIVSGAEMEYGQWFEEPIRGRFAGGKPKRRFYGPRALGLWGQVFSWNINGGTLECAEHPLKQKTLFFTPERSAQFRRSLARQIYPSPKHFEDSANLPGVDVFSKATFTRNTRKTAGSRNVVFHRVGNSKDRMPLHLTTDAYTPFLNTPELVYPGAQRTTKVLRSYLKQERRDLSQKRWFYLFKSYYNVFKNRLAAKRLAKTAYFSGLELPGVAFRSTFFNENSDGAAKGGHGGWSVLRFWHQQCYTGLVQRWRKHLRRWKPKALSYRYQERWRVYFKNRGFSEEEAEQLLGRIKQARAAYYRNQYAAKLGNFLRFMAKDTKGTLGLKLSSLFWKCARQESHIRWDQLQTKGYTDFFRSLYCASTKRPVVSAKAFSMGAPVPNSAVGAKAVALATERNFLLAQQAFQRLQPHFYPGKHNFFETFWVSAARSAEKRRQQAFSRPYQLSSWGNVILQSVTQRLLPVRKSFSPAKKSSFKPWSIKGFIARLGRKQLYKAPMRGSLGVVNYNRQVLSMAWSGHSAERYAHRLEAQRKKPFFSKKSLSALRPKIENSGKGHIQLPRVTITDTPKAGQRGQISKRWTPVGVALAAMAAQNSVRSPAPQGKAISAVTKEVELSQRHTVAVPRYKSAKLRKKISPKTGRPASSFNFSHVFFKKSRLSHMWSGFKTPYGFVSPGFISSRVKAERPRSSFHSSFAESNQKDNFVFSQGVFDFEAQKERAFSSYFNNHLWPLKDNFAAYREIVDLRRDSQAPKEMQDFNNWRKDSMDWRLRPEELLRLTARMGEDKKRLAEEELEQIQRIKTLSAEEIFEDELETYFWADYETRSFQLELNWKVPRRRFGIFSGIGQVPWRKKLANRRRRRRSHLMLTCPDSLYGQSYTIGDLRSYRRSRLDRSQSRAQTLVEQLTLGSQLEKLTTLIGDSDEDSDSEFDDIVEGVLLPVQWRGSFKTWFERLQEFESVENLLIEEKQRHLASWIWYTALMTQTQRDIEIDFQSGTLNYAKRIKELAGARMDVEARIFKETAKSAMEVAIQRSSWLSLHRRRFT